MASELKPKHQQFINEYIRLRCSNATQAYCNVYVLASRETARRCASVLLADANIAAEIKRRVAEDTMSADEVMLRLADIARGDIGDYMGLSVSQIQATGKTSIIKKLTQTDTSSVSKSGTLTDSQTVIIEMYDALAALQLIGKHHDLFVDKLHVKIEKELEKTLDLLEKQLDSDTYRLVLNAISGAATVAADRDDSQASE